MTDDERSLAVTALQEISRHERECGERWGETLNELKSLRAATDAHAERWEKLAWMVIGTIITTACVAITTVVI